MICEGGMTVFTLQERFVWKQAKPATHKYY